MKIEFDFSFVLIGIVAGCRDHRLCSEINRKLNISLSREDNLQLINSNNEDLREFSEYVFESEVDKVKYYLISNKCEGVYLIPERKMYDYFLVIKGEQAAGITDETMERLREISVIQLVNNLQINELKSKENLVFE